MTKKQIADFLDRFLDEEYVYDKATGRIGFIMPTCFPDGTPLELSYYEEEGEYYLTDNGGLKRFLQSAVSHLDKEIADFFLNTIYNKLHNLSAIGIMPDRAVYFTDIPDNAWTIRDGINSFRLGLEQCMNYIFKDYVNTPKYNRERACKVSMQAAKHILVCYCNGATEGISDCVLSEDSLLKHMITVCPSLDRDRALILIEKLKEDLCEKNKSAFSSADALYKKIEALTSLEYEALCQFYLSKENVK